MQMTDKLVESILITLLEIRDFLIAGDPQRVPVPIKTKWLDKQQVMQLLHISERSLCRLRKEGKLNCYRYRGKIYYNSHELDKMPKF